jgi:hypothetical protein
MRLQNHSRETTLDAVATRNQQTIVHNGLQLEDDPKWSVGEESTTQSRGVTPNRIVESNHIRRIRHITVNPIDGTTPEEEIRSRHVVGSLLHNHPGNRSWSDRARDRPLLRTETVICLVQLHREGHITTREQNILHSGDGWVTIIRSCSRNVGK